MRPLKKDVVLPFRCQNLGRSVGFLFIFWKLCWFPLKTATVDAGNPKPGTSFLAGAVHGIYTYTRSGSTLFTLAGFRS